MFLNRSPFLAACVQRNRQQTLFVRIGSLILLLTFYKYWSMLESNWFLLTTLYTLYWLFFPIIFFIKFKFFLAHETQTTSNTYN